MLTVLHGIIVAAWMRCKVSHKGKSTVITVFYKKRGTTACGNYPAISLVAHEGKFPLKIVFYLLSDNRRAKDIRLEQYHG